MAPMVGEAATGRGELAAHGVVDDEDASSAAAASEDASHSSSFSDGDDSSTASESSLDRLIEESDHVSAVAAGTTTLDLPDVRSLGQGQGKRRTPILDRYRVHMSRDGYKVSPKDAEAAATSPNISPFGVCVSEDAGEQHNQGAAVAPNKVQPKAKPANKENTLTRKVYPRTPISKFPVPREEDEDNLSEATDDELHQDDDATSRRLSSSGRDVPFSPQATAIESKAKETSESTMDAQQATPDASRTPLAAAWIEKNMPEEIRLLRILSPKPSTHSPSAVAAWPNTKCAGDKTIRHVSPDEYEKAPRIVKSQVTSDEVGATVTALNAWLASRDHDVSDPQQPAEMTEEQAYGLLGDMFNRRKAKTLFMSLCHWKRLLLRGSSDDGVTFQVVDLL